MCPFLGCRWVQVWQGLAEQRHHTPECSDSVRRRSGALRRAANTSAARRQLPGGELVALTASSDEEPSTLRVSRLQGSVLPAGASQADWHGTGPMGPVALAR